MKVLKYTGLAILLAIVLFILWFSPSYVYRVFVWQDADYDDYTRFAATDLEVSPSPRPFVDKTNMLGDDIEARFDILLPRGSLDSLLRSQETYAFLVVQSDTLLYESYTSNLERYDIQTSFSTAKSILNLLLKAAIDYGAIESVEEPITSYLPELLERNTRFADIRIEDLLRMRSGLAYKHGISFPIVTSDDPLTYLHPDLRNVALEKSRIQNTPDTEFRYNNYNPLLLGLILERATGSSVSALTQKALVDPAGFEYGAFWSTDEHEFEKMESGFNARPIDMAKIGRSMLQFKDDENSNSWYEASLLAMDTITFRSGHRWGYGRMWWMVLEDDVPPHPFANGRFGQFIYLCPVSDFVIIRHGLSPDNWDDDDWTSLFFEFCSTYHDK